MNDFILASKSEIRIKILRYAGFCFKAYPHTLDEDIEKRNFLGHAKDLSSFLACKKSLSLSSFHQNKMILGADQVLLLEDRVLSKPKNKKEAKNQLEMLSGKTHTLYTSLCLTKNKEVLFQFCDQAFLTMKDLSEQLINDYLHKYCGEEDLRQNGLYQIEKAGHFFIFIC